MTYKTCSKCKTKRYSDEYYKGTCKDGLRSWCKICCNSYSRAHPPDKKRKEAIRSYMYDYKRTDAYRARNATYKRNKPVEYHMLRAARERARRKGIGFDLKFEDIKIPDSCPILGIEMRRVRGGVAQACSPTLDRINPSKGYTKDNVWVVSWRANRLKSDATLDELKKIVMALENHAS